MFTLRAGGLPQHLFGSQAAAAALFKKQHSGLSLRSQALELDPRRLSWHRKLRTLSVWIKVKVYSELKERTRLCGSDSEGMTQWKGRWLLLWGSTATHTLEPQVENVWWNSFAATFHFRMPPTVFISLETLWLFLWVVGLIEWSLTFSVEGC